MTEPSLPGDDTVVRVNTVRIPVPHTETLPGYQALADRFGRDQVYILESMAGPERDTRYQFTGFGVLLTISVTRSLIRIDGVPRLRDLVRRRVAPLVDTTGEQWRLRNRRDVWDMLRVIQSTFDAEGSASEFRFGFLGYFGYDTVRYIEDLPYLIEQDRIRPDIHLVLYQGCVVSDFADSESELLLHESSAWPSVDRDEIVGLLAGAERINPIQTVTSMPESFASSDTEEFTYLENVERCLKHIAIGDIYQVQIGHEWNIHSPIDPLTVYQRLRERNASPYMYLTQVGMSTVIGASPELFVRVEDGLVSMRPIAGTAPRGPDDDERARRLSADPKELAEHVMLVDLCRNDIGRICQRDTLAVPDQLVVERYSHVLHLVSTVTGQVEPDKDTYDIIAALFPAGTMTGTPKIRAMEIIEEVERSRRGLYAGALGLIDVGGYVNLALCIRTLIHRDGTFRTRSSAGIVADSEPTSEWRETLAKAGAGYWAVTGKELL